MPENLRVYILDDDEAVRDSMSALLDSYGFEQKVFSSANTFLAEVSPEYAGCLLLDIRMPEMDGLEVLQRLVKDGIKLPVIIITGHGDLPMAVKAMKAGAVDFIEKPFEEDVLVESVRRAMAIGEKIYLEKTEQKNLQSRIERLTPREHEVLVHIASGRQNKVIAYDMGISPRTIEIHRARVIEKMQARNLSHLVRMAIEAGVLLAPN
ncbi:MAG: DNA-binding response regulator [Robiginitomaculum sp.]|nr:MAG: DNA-binding response regulator [Robiginitomaculum sp.]